MRKMFCCFCCMALAIGLITDNMLSSKIYVISLLSLNLFMIAYVYKKEDIGMLFFYLFAILYSAAPIGYIFFDINIAYNDYCQTPQLVSQVLRVLLIFHIIIAYNIKPLKSSDVRIPIYKNEKLYFICLILFLLCFIQGVSGDNIFEGGGYGRGSVGGKNTLFEYGLIPLALMLIYSNNHKRTTTCYILALLYSIKCLLYGGRIEVIEMAVCVLLIKLQNKWNIKKVLYLILAGALFMATWGVFRTLDQGFTLVMSDKNANEVFFSSMRIHYFIEQGILTTGDRAEALLWYFIGTFVPRSLQPPLGNLQHYLQAEYPCGGGGLIVSYFYAFGGYFLVILLSFSIVKVFNSRNSKSVILRLYSLFVVMMIPRWYAYYPVHLIKFCVVGTLLFCIFIKSHGSKRII